MTKVRAGCWLIFGMAYPEMQTKKPAGEGGLCMSHGVIRGMVYDIAFLGRIMIL
ncbi:hypothetical protein AA0614_2548 [Komagataeibacter saccharivorans NRIC 0614]|nr:hypothetical protein AA0614_2548 [Komagataeibacter saccharivorans NRIC 0614]